jgi:hypothetical protein
MTITFLGMTAAEIFPAVAAMAINDKPPARSESRLFINIPLELAMLRYRLVKTMQEVF